MEEFIEKGSRGACYILENSGFANLYTSTCIGAEAYRNFERAGYIFWIAVFALIVLVGFVAAKLFKWTFE